MKCMKIIRNTRNAHTCIFCNRGIPAQKKAIALVEETQVEGHDVKHIEYYCSIECINEQEARDYRTQKAEYEAGQDIVEHNRSFHPVHPDNE